MMIRSTSSICLTMLFFTLLWDGSNVLSFQHSFLLQRNGGRKIRASSDRWLASPMELSLSAENVIYALDSIFETSPYTAAAITCGIKASAADLLAQKSQNEPEKEDKTFPLPSSGKEESSVVDNSIDLQRNAAFVLYGSIYQGLGQQYLYNHLYPAWFGEGSELSILLPKVAFDMLVHSLFFTLPVAYLIKAAVFGDPLGEGIQRYISDIKNNGLLTKYYCLWGPAQCLTFGVVPAHLRIPFITVVSFFWLIILSVISSTPESDAINE